MVSFVNPVLFFIHMMVSLGLQLILFIINILPRGYRFRTRLPCASVVDELSYQSIDQCIVDYKRSIHCKTRFYWSDQ